MNLRSKQNTLAYKVGFGFGLVGLILIGALLFTIIEIGRAKQTISSIDEHQTPSPELNINLLASLDKLIALEYEWLNTKQDSQFQEQQTLWETALLPSIQQLTSLTLTGRNPDITTQLGQLQKSLNNLVQTRGRILQLQQNHDTANAAMVINSEEFPLISGIKTTLRQVLIGQKNQVQSDIQSTQQSINQLLIKDWSFLVIGILLCSILGIILTKSMSRPLINLVEIVRSIAKGKLEQNINIAGATEFEELSKALNEMVNTLQGLAQVTQQMAMGDYSQRVIVKSDDDKLAVAVNQMLDNFNQIVYQANNIAKGDYSLEISPRSDHDLLGISLQNMTRMLRGNKKQHDEENWVKDGSAELTAVISGTSDLPTLCSRAASTITRYLEAGSGVLYLYNKNTKELTLMGSHAYTERNISKNQIALGEGIIGQVALEQKPILLRNIRRQEYVIQTGVTEEPPFMIYAFPLVYEKELIGVMEIASHLPITKLQQRYVEQITPLLSIEIQSAQQQTLTEELLIESKKLAGKLQTQQQELQVTNDELEQQTKTLIASEEALKIKDEQQRAINEKLAERTKELERQKSEIEEKTRTIQAARDALKQKAEELEEASQYKSEFLANMSHELRTPLNSLLILAKLLADNEEGNLTQDQIDSANIMLKSGQDLLTLINDILDLAKVEAGKMEINPGDVRLYDFIENIQRDFTHVAEKRGIALATEYEEGLPEYIFTDDHRVGQIIRNLISNAIKFTEQGEVRFKIMRPKPGARLMNPNLIPDKTIALAVIDTGIGIPEDKQKAVFNSFQQADGTTSRKYGGTGLGLSISTQLANLLGGEISLESAEGKGSIFSLYLPQDFHAPTTVKLPPRDSIIVPHTQVKISEHAPIIEAPTMPAPSVTDDRQSIRPTDKTLLIVEDDLQFTRILLNICRKKGFKCLHSGDAETGLQLATQYHPNGILLDIGLPGMDGLTMLDKLKGDPNTQQIPVHIVSAIDETNAAFKKGAIGYLTKPANREQLESAIQKIEQAYNKNLSDLLIIEPDIESINKMKALLADKEVKISYATSGKDALEKLESQHYDCILLSLNLPDMTGQELVEIYHSKERKEHPAIIIHTANNLSDTEIKQLNSHVDSIIFKGENSSLDNVIKETQNFLHHVETTAPKPVEKATTPAQHPKVIDSQFKDKTVLIVDDDMRNTFALSKTLKSKGVNVIMAANGKTAIETLETHADISLVLMDIMMPVMDGYEAIQKIRQNEKLVNLPIIAVTAKVMKGDKEKCLEIGASDFLAKPIDTDQLVSLLKKWL